MALALAGLAATGAAAQSPVFAPEEVEAATLDGRGDLPEGQSALTLKVQVLLDRAGISPGIVDGWKGGMSESAIRAFERREGFAEDGVLDSAVWEALQGDGGPILGQYVVTEEDHARLKDSLPEDYAALAQMEWLGYTSAAEAIAEAFHMDEDFLREMNPGSAFAVGDRIVVAQPGAARQAEVARIEIDKPNGRLVALDAEGRMVANYPVAVGSAQTPSPSGTHEVRAVAVEPTYSYRPDKNFQQGDNDAPLTLPPGPNGPVGLVWIDLSKPTYGLHGTPDPASLFSAQSHGCVRMTNWDALELARMVGPGVEAEFIE
jgi:lipoprotein-anchoring transpeptidase ErfK/SrfK